MISCIAIDDEPLALQVIRTYLSGAPGIKLVNTFTDAVRALAWVQANSVDLVILDIQMPDITGIQFLQALDSRPLVIFSTAYSEYAVKGFELEAVDYLVKPFKQERVLAALDRARRMMDMKRSISVGPEEEYLFVRSGYGTVCINFNNILYIEGLDDYIKIHLLDQQRPVLSLMSMKSVLEKLPGGRFMRVHRSFIVSIRFIRSIRSRHIFLENQKIPIGETYSDTVHRWLDGR